MTGLGRLIALVLAFIVTPVSGTDVAPLKVGFFLPGIREVNQADLKISLKLWTEELGKAHKVELITNTYDDMRTMRQALERGEINFINAPGMEIAESFTPDDLREGYARRIEGTDEGVALVVPRDAGILTFKDLRGKRLMRLENDRLSEYFLEIQCQKAAAKPCRDFLTLINEKRDIQSVHGVFFGRADAALVNLSTLRTAGEMNPQVTQRLRTLLDWKSKGAFFGMMTRHSEPAYRQVILRSAQNAFKTPRGRQLLQLFRADFLEQVDASALNPYWVLLKEYRDVQRQRAGGEQ